MSHMGKGLVELDSLTEKLRDSLCSLDLNKPDFHELDLGSPVSPLRTTRNSGGLASDTSTIITTNNTGTTTTTSSSSSSSGSAARVPSNGAPHLPKSNSRSGELSTSTETSPTAGGRSLAVAASGRAGPVVAQSRSDPLIYSGGSVGAGGGSGAQSSVSSPAAVNVLPTGNICPSGRILKTGMASRSSKTDVLGSGTANYGHGSIMRGGGSGGSGTIPACAMSPGLSLSRGNVGGGGSVSGRGMGMDPEELKRLGNEMYKKGNLGEALGFYDRAIGLAPGNAAYRSNRAASLIGLGRLGEALRDCEEAVRLDPNYWRAHQRLGSLFIRLGQIENARKHLCFPGQHPDLAELQKLQTVEKHLSRCSDARKVNDWTSALREGKATIAAGADFSPQLIMCRAEALLKLNQLEDAESCLFNIPKLEPYPNSCSQTRFFGMLSEAYPFLVRAQIDMALGRFENAITAAEKAGQIDPQNVEVSVLLKNVRMVASARTRGNDLFKSDRFTEACSAYGEGLRLDPSNSVLYCNRAACWFKLGMWERSVDDCNQALHILPNYTKALLRRAASNSKLERWAEAVRDYEVLRRELPDDDDVAKSLFHVQVALKKSRGEEVYNMKFGGEVEEMSGLEQLRSAISLPGVSVVHFKSSSDLRCKQISPFVDTLCGRYPSINFLKVDIEENPAVANAENVRIVPTFKIYKNGVRVEEIVCPNCDMLEHSVRHYSF